MYEVEVNVTGLAGFLLAKTAAAVLSGERRRIGMISRSFSCTMMLAGRRQQQKRLKISSRATSKRSELRLMTSSQTSRRLMRKDPLRTPNRCSSIIRT